MRLRALVVIVAVVAAHASPAAANTIHVNAAGGADYTTIGEALAAAVDGDEILVWAGTYTGPNNRDLDFGGKSVAVSCDPYTDNPVIDCEQQGRAFIFHSGEDASSRLQGITIVNGSCSGNGGAVLINGAAPWIGECQFINNAATGNGGAICVEYATGTVFLGRCSFWGNTAGLRGGAVNCDHSDTEIDFSGFYENTVTTTAGCRDYGGAGVHAYGGTVTVTASTFASNAASMGASGVHCSSGAVLVENCILAFGQAGPAAMGFLTVTHCDVFGNAGGDSLVDCGHHDNIFLDPLFCDIANDPYSYCANTPCYPESPQNPGYGPIGCGGSECPECDSGVEPVTWGSIKAMYR